MVDNMVDMVDNKVDVMVDMVDNKVGSRASQQPVGEQQGCNLIATDKASLVVANLPRIDYLIIWGVLSCQRVLYLMFCNMTWELCRIF